jgi:hypothetical protein
MEKGARPGSEPWIQDVYEQCLPNCAKLRTTNGTAMRLRGFLFYFYFYFELSELDPNPQPANKLQMASPQLLAKNFAEFYYSTFSTNRAGLQDLYVSDNGMLIGLRWVLISTWSS